MRFFSLRAFFLLGFIVVMPVLALPSVARRIDELLYGKPPADFGRPPPAPAPITAEPVAPSPAAAVVKSTIAPARFDEVSPAPQNFMAAAQASVPAPTAASRYEPTIPPPLPAVPPFAERAAEPEAKIDERTIARLQQIRQRLEQLGADYVLVDMQDSGRFRFHCRMLVDPRTTYTRPFDAMSFDPIVAGEQVLSDVEKWHQTAASVPSAISR